MIISGADRELLALLSENSRQSTTQLARRLEVSRSTLKSRIERLERRGIIKGYTVRLSDEYQLGQILAHVMINTDPKLTSSIVRLLRNMREVRALYAVNGLHDMIAMVAAESTHTLDEVLDRIGNTEGIEKTVSSIILSTKFER